ncbi:helix-turn-helix domain-containing protein [Alteribacillus sp. YIM 98480]|uniref:helix-turn-helix domain-containing protein n=1 Tax=Alteribacillus sp. YIM 98480 TaxID=2606599 RepID=UPI001E299EC8|nr:helix-turn-helix domain-containing protein [Alteribacillus sp. YIM 98480]
MSELGQFLKTKREEKELSLEKMQEITKIQKRYLSAIENGKYEALPGAFYTRAFVKSYAEALALDPDDIFETYGGELPQPKQQATDLPSRAERTRPKVQKKKKRKSNVFPVLMGILFFVVVAAGVYLVVQGADGGNSGGVSPEDDPSIEVDSNDNSGISDEDAGNEEDDEPTEDSREAEEDENGSIEKEDEIEEAENEEPEFLSTDNRRSTFDVSGLDEMMIELELSGDSYLDVQDKNGTILEDFAGVSEGDTVELDYSDEDYVKLNIGNATAVTVRFNGQVIDYPIDPSEAVHQHLIFDKQAE